MGCWWYSSISGLAQNNTLVAYYFYLAGGWHMLIALTSSCTTGFTLLPYFTTFPFHFDEVSDLPYTIFYLFSNTVFFVCIFLSHILF